MWLGNKRGYLQDWITQQWVKTTGQRVTHAEHKWLFGPAGGTKVIADDFVKDLQVTENLRLVKNGQDFGLLDSIQELNLADNGLDRRIKDFYESTINYHFEVWSSWKAFFYPFGSLLNTMFSKRLEQLNLPLDAIESSRGIASNVWKLLDDDGHVHYTIWYRILKATEKVIYSGVYTTVYLPALNQTCLKVIFPLPNGNATVIMRIEVRDDGSLLLISEGRKFGDPGFYFFLTDKENNRSWGKYVKAMHETIHVYIDEEHQLRTDHILNLHGITFLKLHYKMARKDVQP